MALVRQGGRRALGVIITERGDDENAAVRHEPVVAPSRGLQSPK